FSRYLVLDHKPQIDKEYLSEAVKNKIENTEANVVPDNSQNTSNDGQEPPAKKIRLKGRNKHRPIEKRPDDADKLCPAIRQERECSFAGKCKFSHDLKAFFESKPADLGSSCYLYETFGKCPYGLTCRYGAKHIDQNYKSIVNKELWEKNSHQLENLNYLSKDVQKLLWKKKYDFNKANTIHKQVVDILEKRKKVKESKRNSNSSKNSEDSKEDETSSDIVTDEAVPTLGCVSDEDFIKLRPKEVKLIDFSNKLYLAPLTTVGNLPFRRICKEYGVDITCGEMALSTNLLQGQQSEWALLRRHPSEDIFGVQICGGFPDTMTRCAQLLQEQTTVDFIDINCGCPIDMIYKKGEGCALMSRNYKFEQIIRSMVSVLNIPLTVKMRTGVWSYKNIAHELTPKLRDWGVSMVTLHGRSREQRYTRLAAWDYIETCCNGAKPMPFFGNGDVLSYEDYNNYKKRSGVDGIMIARGALIKPWIFKEIKDEQHWDISASERLEMLQRFCNYGLSHWGSDQQGVDTVRRFLLEWLSFLHRYIPVGILEHPPQKINERPPYYKGRNELETLLSSANCGDWVKISEMLLGPVKPDFKFLPKHKANAYQ
ncbi:hypothetical protein LOTGIDRAFT_144742, partial [Lottia gigantea]